MIFSKAKLPVTDRRREEGFTLLEILIAVTLLSIGLLGAAGLTTTIIQGNEFSSKLSQATTLVQDKMEDIRRLGYSGTASTDTTTTEDYNSITNYAGLKRVTLIDVDNPSAGIKTVTVTIFWDSDDESISLQTILTQ